MPGVAVGVSVALPTPAGPIIAAVVVVAFGIYGLGRLLGWW
jgi:hypothetical protein